jgi:hypothetical protein
MCGGLRISRYLGGVSSVFAAALAGSMVVWPARPCVAESASTSQSSEQRHFSTPEAAVAALIEAFKADDEAALLDLFGRDHEKLVVRTDKVAHRQAMQRLYQASQEGTKLEKDGDAKRVLILGKLEWPFPIPLVKDPRGWGFDADAGEEEILNRRIGRDELTAITTCRAYVSAQVEYAREDRDGDEVREYAQRLGSTPGKKDGLYWEVKPDSDEEPSPFGPLLADADVYHEAAKKAKTRIPYHGYYFKVLTRQGPNPPGGKYDYIINGNMIAGFALVAWPADYGSSGIMTFVVSHQGKVYQKDLGEKTGEIAAKMTEYNPDKTWTLVEE